MAFSGIAFTNSSGYYLQYFVGRAKSCLDFTFTLHLIHFISCCLHMSTLPSILWWSTQFFAFLIMVLWGEYLCMKQEMEPIYFSAANGMTNSDDNMNRRGRGLKSKLSDIFDKRKKRASNADLLPLGPIRSK